MFRFICYVCDVYDYHSLDDCMYLALFFASLRFSSLLLASLRSLSGWVWTSIERGVVVQPHVDVRV